MNKKKDKDERPKVEQALLEAMQSLDSQIARELQRTPAERELLGVLKWEPYQKRIEQLSSFIINAIGDDEARLDSLLVLLQACAKSFQIMATDLGEEGLGKIRSAYCLTAAETVERDCTQVVGALKNRFSC